MLDLMTTLFSYGPPGGIDASVAMKWAVIWTVVLGGALYISLFYPQWVPTDDEPQ